MHRHEVTVNPKVFVKPSTIGNERTIYLKVIDSRPNNYIHKRHENFKTNKVRIVADSSLEDSITESIKRGFQDLGFRVKTRPEADASSLKIAISETKFSMFANTSSFHQQMRAGFRVAVKTGSQKYPLEGF